MILYVVMYCEPNRFGITTFDDSNIKIFTSKEKAEKWIIEHTKNWCSNFDSSLYNKVNGVEVGFCLTNNVDFTSAETTADSLTKIGNALGIPTIKFKLIESCRKG